MTRQKPAHRTPYTRNCPMSSGRLQLSARLLFSRCRLAADDCVGDKEIPDRVRSGLRRTIGIAQRGASAGRCGTTAIWFSQRRGRGDRSGEIRDRLGPAMGAPLRFRNWRVAVAWRGRSQHSFVGLLVAVRFIAGGCHRSDAPMIDQVRKEIQDRLDQLLAEADRLHRALAALGGGGASAPADSAPRSTRAGTKGRRGARTTRRKSAVSTEARSRSVARDSSSTSGSSVSVTRATRGRSRGQRSRTRAAQGQTKSAVLAALSSGEAMTAGEVAAVTGLGRATVSTTTC